MINYFFGGLTELVNQKSKLIIFLLLITMIVSLCGLVLSGIAMNKSDSNTDLVFINNDRVRIH